MSFGKKDFKYFIIFYFLIKDGKFLEKYNEIWKNVSNIIKKELESKPVYNKKYLKTNGKISTNIHNNKIPKEGSQCICL